MVERTAQQTAQATQATDQTQSTGHNQLEILARQLATDHVLARRNEHGKSLHDHLQAVVALLESAYEYYRAAPAEELSFSYTAEWVLDNYYLAQEVIRQIKEDLPEEYYTQLPKLASGPLGSYPRIYDLARNIVIHEHADVEPERLRRFITTYQRSASLTMGEIWALPIFVRISLLAAIAQGIREQIDSLQETDLLFPSLEFPKEVNPQDLVANSFLSLRRLGVLDWNAFFEAVSRVEQILRRDPAGVYSRMDFTSRDQYRKAIEELAWDSGLDEVDIARHTVVLAQSAGVTPTTRAVPANQKSDGKATTAARWKGIFAPRNTHVGYYLVDAGREQLEIRLGYHPAWTKRLERWSLGHPGLLYFGAIGLASVLWILAALTYAWANGGSPIELIGTALLAIVPVITATVSLVHLVITRMVPPKVLPKLDFRDGIPPAAQSIVVIPALLSNPKDISFLIQQVEQHYLRNPDPRISYALLTDFSDSPQEHAPEDEDLINSALDGIRDLNRRYRRKSSSPFYLFHRSRQWNPQEGVWMAWERKRGKLAELNRLILGDTWTSFIVQEGDLSILPQTRYVITLDADTVLPRGSAQRLVGTIAHPLNRAEIDSQTGKVTAGYTILQPRTEVKPTSANQSLFTRIFSGDMGIDLYTRAVSDVYQDFFGEGIYVGKGLYDVRAFDRSLAGRVPDNALLSHDLFEGNHGRVALVSDTVLYEDYPPTYQAFGLRMQRWIRGDWQLLPWLFHRVPITDGKRANNVFSVLDLWKIIDNLRRSLLAPCLIALLVSAWTWLPGSILGWTIVGVLVPAVPLLTSFISWSWQRLRAPQTVGVAHALRWDIARWFLNISLLPHEALISLQAILITLNRVFFTRHKMLEWTPAAYTNRLSHRSMNRLQTWLQMSDTIWLILLIVIGVWLIQPVALPVAAPFLILWFLSPMIVERMNKPIVQRQAQLNAAQYTRLRNLARRTWLYFEQFVGPDDHWLPPDHYQESPVGKVAHRTSPTNIGMLLLSTLAAYDLGYASLLGMVTRLRSTFDTLARLERYRGHFLNWYDTRSLDPLPPRYVSTVDSGNLACSLIVLSQYCQSLRSTPILRWNRWEGLLDTLDVFSEIMAGLTLAEGKDTAQAVLDSIGEIRQQVLVVKTDPAQWPALLQDVQGRGWNEIYDRILAFIEACAHQLDAETFRALRTFADRVQYHMKASHRDIELLAPWLFTLDSAPLLLHDPQGNPIYRQTWIEMLGVLPQQVCLEEIPGVCREGRSKVEALKDLLSAGGDPGEMKAALDWCDQFLEKLDSARNVANSLIIGYGEIQREAEQYFHEMEFRFLYDLERRVFHIGYNLDSGRADPNYYDLLASEARITSLIAIAKREVPQSHWLQLGRPITQIDGKRALLSWSATMFEYLMPNLFARSYEGTLLHESCMAAIEHQIAYGKARNVPWGVSESGYYAFDAASSYQYRAFGVPGLGFKRGLGDDLVVTPYASILALPFRPADLMTNLEHLEKFSMLGLYGFYESIDFTPARLALGQKYALVKAFMAHHQGMILLSLANYLDDHAIIRRFHSDPRIQSVELLLQEMVPQSAPIEEPNKLEGRAIRPERSQTTANPWHAQGQSRVPVLHFLSNGSFSTLITNSGSGFSRWGEIDLTRWRADPTLDNYGLWIYIQDRESGELWSAGYQPTASQALSQEVWFYPHKVEFQCRDHDISTRMEVVIPPHDDLEVRIVRLVNHSDQTRHLTLTSYGEVILAQQSTDQRHPAFNNLFIESEYDSRLNALIFHRRQRSRQESPVYLLHGLVSQEELDPSRIYESDRAHFLGRGRTTRHPVAFIPAKDGSIGQALSGSSGVSLHRHSENLADTSNSGETGETLDPIMSLAQEVELEPHAEVQLAFITIAGESREAVLEIVERYQTWSLIERSVDQARSQAEIELHKVGIDSRQLEQFQQLLSVLLLPQKALRAPVEVLRTNRKGQSGLWGYAISGDYPILLVRLYDLEDTALLADVLRAHAYWRNRGLMIDLVILNLKESGYSQELAGNIYRLITGMKSDTWINARGGIFILRSDQMSAEDLVALNTAARAILEGRSDQGSARSLAEQVKPLSNPAIYLPPLTPTLTEPVSEPTPPVERPAKLNYANGIGGFSQDGREYVLYLEPGDWTPLPWVNVIANEQFGFLVSESGSGYSWAINSGENRLTSWSNDPVSDRCGEALYLRDEETSEVWSPTPLPARADAPYLVRHGAGYSEFEHNSHGLRQSLRLFAVADAPVKSIRLRLENTWQRVRRITATYYAEWTLGVDHPSTLPYIISDFDPESQILFARNTYNTDFADRVAFLASDHKIHGLTTDRTEFLGRMGSLGFPRALRRIGLSGSLELGGDPCGALMVHVDLQPGEVVEVNFLLGQGANRDEAVELVQRYRQVDALEKAWQELNLFWDQLLGTVQVHTPDPAFDLLLNRWLLYQSLSCRVWGRSGFYQSSGAYGFRDQLQDVLSLLFAKPDVARQHILRSAAHQFETGDVLHWWHPPAGRGVRTRFSDDLIWLPYVTAQYLTATGDLSILDEQIQFRTGTNLEPGEIERYGDFPPTQDYYSLYDHCRRALEKGVTFGPHSLPLMGSGDWNDGMNRVGIEGRGESVWLGWFLVDSLLGFAEICDRRGDKEAGDLYRKWASEYQKAIEAAAWDGKWYLRAYYDDGSKLGSITNQECQIDSIAQSWAVLSDAGEPGRARQAMDSVWQRLVRPKDHLILLFAPPFDKTTRDPGYIRGYVPGIRENGGQYTHAALWAIWAYTRLGEGDKAMELLGMINPVGLSDSPDKVTRYKVEPYVVASDVYSVAPHTGRGGWTWYTGSSAWMYRLGIEAILGLHRQGEFICFDPCIPREWTGFEITLRKGTATYQIKVENPEGVNRGIKDIIVDGDRAENGSLRWVDDGRQHSIRVLLG